MNGGTEVHTHAGRFRNSLVLNGFLKISGGLRHPSTATLAGFGKSPGASGSAMRQRSVPEETPWNRVTGLTVVSPSSWLFSSVTFFSSSSPLFLQHGHLCSGVRKLRGEQRPFGTSGISVGLLQHLLCEGTSPFTIISQP